MPKIIFKCSYLKNNPKVHLENLIKYIATREGVEKIDDTKKLFPATEVQKRTIESIIKAVPKIKILSEYKDYTNNPTIENASILIQQAIENNIDLMLTKKNFVQYISKRPRVEKIGTHGLFTDDAKNMKILPDNLKWYAAFHNESHHPHVHLIAYSVDPKEGYVTRYGIENMREAFAKEIFKQDLIQIYEHKDESKIALRKEVKDTINKIELGEHENKEIEKLMMLLSRRLKNTKGKKVYGYLKSDVKDIVDSILDELSKEKSISKLYLQWCEYQKEIIGIYKDEIKYEIPLSKQKEFKHIKNMIIQEALNIFEPDKSTEIIDKKFYDFFLLSEKLNEEQKNIYSKFIVDNKDNYKNPFILMCAIKFIHNILKVLTNEYEQKNMNVPIKVDRKLMKKLKQKKISQGHKQDETSQQIN